MAPFNFLHCGSAELKWASTVPQIILRLINSHPDDANDAFYFDQVKKKEKK